ncbi:Necrosis-inducing secreted protein 1 [Cladobotryum mycophilum]|uniref:Necrosis-inducing secreted protein 1 n=1 Tax=Cladobotryum mycophilum TaxID=491253 RepID=A0ABR0T0F2_9HYPO
MSQTRPIVTTYNISGIAVSEIIKPGDKFTVRLTTKIASGSVRDTSIAIGWFPQPKGSYYPGSIGMLAESFDLVSRKYSIRQINSIIGKNNQAINMQITTPVAEWNVPGDDVLVTASMFTLIGAMENPILINWAVPVQFGNETSTVYKNGNRILPN